VRKIIERENMKPQRRRIIRTTVGVILAQLCLLLPAVTLADQAPGHYRAYIDGPWGQIHVRVDGPRDADAPSVVLLHQMVWSSLQFEHVQPLLAQHGVRSIAVDLPGYGLSDGPPHVPTAAEYANSLLPVLDHFELPRAILHGNHTGATIAVAFAQAHPQRVEGLILQGPPIFDAETRSALLAEEPFDQTPQSDGSHLLRRWQQASSSFGANTSLASRHRSVLEFFTAGPREWYAHDAVFRYDLAPIIERLNTPTLILTNPGDSLHDAARQVSAMRPDFDYRELAWPGAHAIYDDPAPWAEAAAAYASGLEPAGQ
jgi:haloalkane dehalogenase